MEIIVVECLPCVQHVGSIPSMTKNKVSVLWLRNMLVYHTWSPGFDPQSRSRGRERDPEAMAFHSLLILEQLSVDMCQIWLCKGRALLGETDMRTSWCCSLLCNSSSLSTGCLTMHLNPLIHSGHVKTDVHGFNGKHLHLNTHNLWHRNKYLHLRSWGDPNNYKD